MVWLSPSLDPASGVLRTAVAGAEFGVQRAHQVPKGVHFMAVSPLDGQRSSFVDRCFLESVVVWSVCGGVWRWVRPTHVWGAGLRGRGRDVRVGAFLHIRSTVRTRVVGV